MATISINASVYNKALDYAQARNLTVDEWVTSLIRKFVPAKKQKYRMKKMDELSADLQRMVGFAKPSQSQPDDINCDAARSEYLRERLDR